MHTGQPWTVHAKALLRAVRWHTIRFTQAFADGHSITLSIIQLYPFYPFVALHPSLCFAPRLIAKVTASTQLISDILARCGNTPTPTHTQACIQTQSQTLRFVLIQYFLLTAILRQFMEQKFFFNDTLGARLHEPDHFLTHSFPKYVSVYTHTQKKKSKLFFRQRTIAQACFHFQICAQRLDTLEDLEVEMGAESEGEEARVVFHT